MARNTKRRMKLRHRLLMPNVAYLLVLGIVGVMFFKASSSVGTLAERQKGLAEAAASLRELAKGTLRFFEGAAAVGDVAARCRAARQNAAGLGLSLGLDGLDRQLGDAGKILARNEEIRRQVAELCNASSAQSDAYIDQVSAKLADPNQRKEVSRLERLVIAGAAANTRANYQVRLLFDRLGRDPAAAKELRAFLEALQAQAEKDIQRLHGTPFAKLPVKALEANRRTRGLATELIANTDRLRAMETAALGDVEKATAAIDDAVSRSTQESFATVQDYLVVLAVSIAVVAIGGAGFALVTTGRLVRALERIITALGAGANQTASAAGQVSAASQSLAQGTTEQAASLEETSSSVEQMASMTRQNAENARQANNLMAEASAAVGEGKEAMDRLVSAIGEIKRSSDETGKIVRTIDEIAFQTNLLALNAAVEAARAGEAGKGFAVVAEEVRNLAQRSAEAARTTSELIDSAVHNAENGVTVAEKTNETFERVTDSAGRAERLIGEIAAASDEQADGIQQITTAVAQIDQLTQANAATAEESASSAEQLNAQAEELNGIVRELRDLLGGSGGLRQGGHASGSSTGAERFRTEPTAPSGKRAPRKSTAPSGEAAPRKTAAPSGEAAPRKTAAPSGEAAPRKSAAPSGKAAPRKTAAPAGRSTPGKPPAHPNQPTTAPVEAKAQVSAEQLIPFDDEDTDVLAEF